MRKFVFSKFRNLYYFYVRYSAFSRTSLSILMKLLFSFVIYKGMEIHHFRCLYNLQRKTTISSKSRGLYVKKLSTSHGKMHFSGIWKNKTFLFSLENKSPFPQLISQTLQRSLQILPIKKYTLSLLTFRNPRDLEKNMKVRRSGFFE